MSALWDHALLDRFLESLSAPSGTPMEPAEHHATREDAGILVGSKCSSDVARRDALSARHGEHIPVCLERLTRDERDHLVWSEPPPITSNALVFGACTLGGSPMLPHRFDRLTQALSNRLSRRSARRASAWLGGLALVCATMAPAAAQEAPPVAPDEKAVYLFIQTFESGSLRPKEGEKGIFVLTLEGDHGRTIGFSDRPERIVGSAPTQAFLDGLGFSPTNPPNAALVLEPAADQTDVIVLELFNPQYDEAARRLTYDVRILDTFEFAGGLSFHEQPRPPDPAGETFGAAQLFIDDCPDLVSCYNGIQYEGPIGPYGQCWSWDNWTCAPDHCSGGSSIATLNQTCNNTHPGCQGQCQVSSFGPN